MIITLIIAVLIGALIGFIAGKIMKSENGFWVNAALGIAGSFVGGIIGKLLGAGSGSSILNYVLSVAGACLVIWVVRKLKQSD